MESLYTEEELESFKKKPKEPVNTKGFEQFLAAYRQMDTRHFWTFHGQWRQFIEVVIWRRMDSQDREAFSCLWRDPEPMYGMQEEEEAFRWEISELASWMEEQINKG